MDLKTEVTSQLPVIVGKTATGATYFTSAGLFIGSSMDWLNDNAGAVGVVIALATFSVNLYFQIKRDKK
jgi:hypothetical protein